MRGKHLSQLMTRLKNEYSVKEWTIQRRRLCGVQLEMVRVMDMTQHWGSDPLRMHIPYLTNSVLYCATTSEKSLAWGMVFEYISCSYGATSGYLDLVLYSTRCQSHVV